ncbi:MGMT family protein [Brachybacterium hainanense]|uniref:MGMT family protein n=1 Tax=Brachybacterium hainanense TaxID=1541174 RepID=A0ABV6RF54_9MICO
MSSDHPVQPLPPDAVDPASGSRDVDPSAAAAEHARRDEAGRTHEHGAGRARMDDVTVERVLRTVEQIPPGRVAAYGQIGAIVGIGPRLVGRIMSTWGGSVTWWRVTNASGDLPGPLLARARARWEAEGITMKPNGRGTNLRRHGADLGRLRAQARESWAELPELRSGSAESDGEIPEP